MFLDLTPLKISRDYRLLFFGQMVSFLGTMITFVVVPWQMYAITGSNLMFGLAFVVVALADSIDRRSLFQRQDVHYLRRHNGRRRN